MFPIANKSTKIFVVQFMIWVCLIYAQIIKWAVSLHWCITYSFFNYKFRVTILITFRLKISPEILSMHCKTPEPSPTFEKTEHAENSSSRYQYNAQTLRNELDKVISQNKNGKIKYNI